MLSLYLTGQVHKHTFYMDLSNLHEFHKMKRKMKSCCLDRRRLKGSVYEDALNSDCPHIRYWLQPPSQPDLTSQVKFSQGRRNGENIALVSLI